MKMTLHSIPHQKGEYHGLSKPQGQNFDSVEKVDGHRDPSGSIYVDKIIFFPTTQWEVNMDNQYHEEEKNKNKLFHIRIHFKKTKVDALF
jgi:hypothetical protein